MDLDQRRLAPTRAQAEVQQFREALGPFVIAAEKTRMPMAFTDAGTPDDVILFANDSFLALTGFSREELVGRGLASMIVGRRDPETMARTPVQGQYRRDTETDMMFRRKDGSEFCADMLKCVVADKAGEVVQNFVSLVDLTKYKKSEAALRLSEHRFRVAAQTAGLGIADIDLLTGEEHWSAELRALLGVSDDMTACARTYSALIHPDDHERAMNFHHRSLAGQGGPARRAAFRIVRPNDGALRWVQSERHAEQDELGNVVRVIVTNRDITTEKTAQDRITWAATHDSVTGLLNRTSFRGQAETALAASSARGEVCSLLLIDLDQFKSINDKLGHQAGDEALAAFAVRVVEAMPEGAILARLGGDEFAAVLPAVDIAGAEEIGRRLLTHLKRPFLIATGAVDLQASVGVSAFPRDGRGYSALVHNADLALYSAKEAGGAALCIFAPALAARRQREMAKLRHARVVLARGWIEPFYQPKILLVSGAVAGFEALLRWRHPRAGLQTPATIAPAFDDGHLAGLLGAAMAEAVLADMSGWMKRGCNVGKVALNVSAAEFRTADYADRLLERVKRHGIAAASIELEITETAFLEERAGSVVTTLGRLRAAGMTVALDDFGTGFSSLSHLRNFPVDTIKIDHSFVVGLENSQRDRDIVQAVLQLGSALGMTTVAEGIENEAQADFLAAHGCLLGQGHYFAPALDAAAAMRRVKELDLPSRS